MKPNKPNKIYWTFLENGKVARAYAELLFKNPHWPMVRLFKTAMENSLPPDRVRPLYSNSPGIWVREHEAALKLAREQILNEEVVKNAPIQPEPTTELPVVLADPMQELLVASVLKLLSDPRISEAIRNIVQCGRQIPLYEVQPKLKHQAILQQPPRPQLQKVMIVGLLKNQMGEIEKSHGSKFQLVFKDADADRNQVKAVAQTCDFVVVMTKFISHDVEGHVVRHAKLLKRCNGSVTDLQRILTASIKP